MWGWRHARLSREAVGPRIVVGRALLACAEHPCGFENRSCGCAVIHEVAAEVVVEPDKGPLALFDGYAAAGMDVRRRNVPGDESVKTTRFSTISTPVTTNSRMKTVATMRLTTDAGVTSLWRALG